MTFKIIVFMVTIWIAMSLLCGVAEGALLSMSTGSASVSKISILMHGDFANTSFWSTVGGMITFDFPALFSGPYTMTHWLFFVPLILAFGVMMGGFLLAHIPLIGRGT